MINPAVLVTRIKEAQMNLAVGSVQFPSSDVLRTGIQAGKWQGMEDVLKLIDEILHEDDELDR